MSFGKRILEFFAAAAGIVFLMALVWFFFSGFQDKGYEEGGTLVQREEGLECLPEPAFEAVPAFVTDPRFAADLHSLTGVRSAGGL